MRTLKKIWWRLREEAKSLALVLLGAVPGGAGVWLRARGMPLYLQRLGHDTTLQAGLRVTNPEKVSIGAHCNFGQDVFITGGGGVTIGDWVGFGPDVKIWSVTHRYSDPDRPWLLQGWDMSPVVIEDDVWLGANVFVMPGVTIGRGAIVSACALVNKSIPPYAVVVGNPARVVSWRKPPAEADAAAAAAPPTVPEAELDEPQREESGKRLGRAKRLGRTVVSATVGLMVLAVCSSPRQSAELDMAAIGSDLQAVAQARVLLGHQSVGRNILAGVQSLAQQTGVRVRIVEIDRASADTGPGLFHTPIGRNGHPDEKCEAFSGLLEGPERPRYDVAMMKFCYVDLESGTAADANAILDRYTRMVQQLRERRPDVRLVHVTMPLRSDPPGWKTTVKRLIGRATEEDSANVLRNEFNAGLRQRFAGEVIFDLAAAQSTLPDGTRSKFSQDSRPIYTLASSYTTDGGHLNEEGQRWVAAHFLSAVARSLRAQQGGE